MKIAKQLNLKLIRVHKSFKDDDSDSLVPIQGQKIIKKRKLIKIHQSPEDDDSDSYEPNIKNGNIIKKRKLIKIRQSSQGDNSDSSAPVIKNRKKKHRMHRLKKIRKLRKSKKESLPIPSNPIRTDLFNQYGIDTYGSNIVRKLNTIQNLARFKPRQHNASINGVGLLGQLSGT